jgi:uncharacterized protein YejL (UPF0352 family)
MVKLEDIIKRLAGVLEEQYNVEKQTECEKLQNRIIQVLEEEHATVQNALFVLELVKFQLLSEKFAQILTSGKVSEKVSGEEQQKK